ncbi:MAG: HAMP domain-containing sensor histidine kinase [Alphaproteobacteria bacterium]|nr:HAMP domain-containing sensor histidine kinase [Alphaproteobacteria bacterium]
MFDSLQFELNYPLAAMLLMDILMIAAAIGLSVTFFRYRKPLKRAKAVSGISLILAAFWIITIFYVCDLFILIALPQQIGVAAAKEQMFDLSLRYIWHVGLMLLSLMTLGILFALKAFLDQNDRLAAAKSEAETYNRQKSNFLSSMSHEFRTPLNAITGFAEFMRHNVRDGQTGRVAEYSDYIVKSSEMLRRLIDDLLDLSRIEAGRLQLSVARVSITELVKEAMELLTGIAKETGVKLEFQHAAATPTIFADRRALTQVLYNLISNAIKFSPNGSAVSVTVEAGRTGGIYLTVRNFGDGIAPALLDTIFEPFVHGDPLLADSKVGHGLGLMICKKLVEMHGGTIRAESSMELGTNIIVFLPEQPPVRPEEASIPSIRLVDTSMLESEVA